MDEQGVYENCHGDHPRGYGHMSSTPIDCGMTDQLSRPTAADIAAFVGAPVTAHQLKYWRRMGLIARPTQVGLVGQFGTRATYEPGTERVVAALLHTLKQTRNLEDLVWTAWMEGRPMSEMRPALITLLDRRERDFRAQLAAWGPRGRTRATVRTAQRRTRHTSGAALTQVHARHRSVVAYLVAAIMFGEDRKGAGRFDVAGDALWDVLRSLVRLRAETRQHFIDALPILAREASVANVRQALATPTTPPTGGPPTKTLDAVADTMWALLRPARALGALGDSGSWFPLFLLVFIAYDVSPSVARALYNVNESLGTPVEVLVSTIKAATIRQLVAEDEATDLPDAKPAAWVRPASRPTEDAP